MINFLGVASRTSMLVLQSGGLFRKRMVAIDFNLIQEFPRTVRIMGPSGVSA